MVLMECKGLAAVQDEVARVTGASQEVCICLHVLTSMSVLCALSASVVRSRSSLTGRLCELRLAGDGMPSCALHASWCTNAVPPVTLVNNCQAALAAAAVTADEAMC